MRKQWRKYIWYPRRLFAHWSKWWWFLGWE